MERGMRDNEITPKFMQKTSKEVKNHGPRIDKKNISMKSNQGVQGFT